MKIKAQDWALASLALLANMNRTISTEMLSAALAVRFKEVILDSVMELVDRVSELS